MDPNPATMLRAAIPKIPLVLKLTAAHSLGLSDTSSKWTLQQEIIIKVVRSFLDPSNPPRPMLLTQRSTLRDPGVKGKMWVSRYTIPKGTEAETVTGPLFGAIDAMRCANEEYLRAELRDVEVEWTGYRQNCKGNEPAPDIGDAEKWTNLCKEVTSDVVILYIHGGAMYLMDPATHRGATAKLAELTGGKSYSVRYRLAPQNPFPSALMDVFVAYLSLLAPPPGAPHKPMLAKNIIISGDSAGGCLSLALLQLILQLNRMAPENQTAQVHFHGQSVAVDVPGGVALNSPWCDITSCMGSIQRFAKYDYLPNQFKGDRIPEDSIWPAKPARVDIYAEGSAMCHPLVSPIAAQDWTGSPPVYFACGEELLADEARAVACRMARQGVPVVWEQYEAMPHCFGLVFPTHDVGKMCFDSWSRFCKDAVTGRITQTKGTYIVAKKLDRHEVSVEDLLDEIEVKEEDIPGMMKTRQDWAIGKFNEMQAARGLEPKL